jgi:signal transduction histidine kinase
MIEKLKKIGMSALFIILSVFSIIIFSYSGHILLAEFPKQYFIMFSFFLGIFIYASLYIFYLRVQRVEQTKRAFITIAAHNLRTPLTKVQWLLADIESRIGELSKDEEVHGRFEDIKKTNKDLVKVVNRLLEVSESGKNSAFFSYIFDEQHLEFIVLQAMSNHKFGIKEKNLSVSTRIQEGLPFVIADKERIELVANIIMENAVLYSEKNGSIEIEIYQEKNNVVCSVQDTGIGITKENLPKIFTRFYRSQEAITKDVDRVGLGLSLAKEIIEKHAGSIHVDSKGIGLGSRFWFTLPISKN